MHDKNTDFNLEKLIKDVFQPGPDERVLIMSDIPRDGIPDHPEWEDRRRMAEEWKLAFKSLTEFVAPLLSYPATGAGNADLPETGTMDGKTVSILECMADYNILVGMTEYSATAPLAAFVKRHSNIRAASMPGVLRRMEQSALAADYREVARKTHILSERLTRARSARVIFSTGHIVDFDLRERTGHSDDGLCVPGKAFPVINLPSGEAFIVPYEGENAGQPSQTQGEIPISGNGETYVLQVEGNKIMEVAGDGRNAAFMRSFFEVDTARRNIAELGLGCNDRAVVLGNVLEDEKAGMHWAYGRSEHLGGTIGPDSFTQPGHVVHQDIVYAPGSGISVDSVRITYLGGGDEEIMNNNEYTVF